MYILNKIVGGVLNPVMIGLMIIAAGAALAWFGRRKSALATLGAAFAWIWLWGTAVWTNVIGLPLEKMYPPMLAEDTPAGDVIILLGGGMSFNGGVSPYPDMCEGGDRAWHAARLYHAGKAPVIIPSGGGDLVSTVPLLVDLGVPRSAIKVENAARNTEENAKFVANMLKREDGKRPRALLVTSATHMRRSMLMYTRYAPDLEMIPAATDHCIGVCTDRPFKVADFFPTTDFYQKSGAIMKELVGYWGYRLFRR